MLSIVLCGCKTWSLTLREENRLKVFENEVLRKLFEAKRHEITGEWRKLHNAELHALYSSPNMIRYPKTRRLRWTGHVAHMEQFRNVCRVLVGKPEKEAFREADIYREDNIKMDLRDVGCDPGHWMILAEDGVQWRAYVRAIMNIRTPLKPIS